MPFVINKRTKINAAALTYVIWVYYADDAKPILCVSQRTMSLLTSSIEILEIEISGGPANGG